MGQLLFYAFFYGRELLFEHPLLLSALIALYLLRHRFPSPVMYLRTARHVARLQREVSANPDNVTARRALAQVWLKRRRPKKAEQLLVEARRRDPDMPELSYLLAQAKLARGDANAAIDLCIDAATRDPKLRFGDVYRVAAVALLETNRLPEAEDALLRLLKINSSSVEGWTRLASVRRKQGDMAGAKAALDGAVEAFQHSPHFRKRAELGWYLRARLGVLLS
ncbi:MAG: tetratricopeptide repeat protein [Polyangia bacterium]